MVTVLEVHRPATDFFADPNVSQLPTSQDTIAVKFRVECKMVQNQTCNGNGLSFDGFANLSGKSFGYSGTNMNAKEPLPQGSIYGGSDVTGWRIFIIPEDEKDLVLTAQLNIVNTTNAHVFFSLSKEN